MIQEVIEHNSIKQFPHYNNKRNITYKKEVSLEAIEIHTVFKD